MALLCHLLSVAAFAAFSRDDAGTAGAQFLGLGASARAAGMGEAFSAAVQDASAVRYNPAAMTRIDGNSLSLMHNAYLQNTFLDYASFVRRLDPERAVGFSLLYMNYGSIQKTDASNTPLGTAHPSDLAFSAAYADQIHPEGFLDDGSMGLSLSYIRSRIVSSAGTLAVSMGVLTRPFGFSKARLAFVLENLGSKMKFDKTSDPLPLTARLGGALYLDPDDPEPSWLMATEIAFPRDMPIFGALGMEKRFESPQMVNMVLRAGLNTKTLGSLGGLSGLSLGMGFFWSASSLDYAFVPFGDLGQTHRVSLSLRFDAWESKSSPPPRLPAPAARLPEPVPGPVAAKKAPLPPSSPWDPTRNELYQTHLKQAKAAEEVREYERAAEEYEKALKLWHWETQPHLDLAGTLMALEDWDGAAAQWLTALKLLPEDDSRQVYGMERLGAVAVKKGENKKAERFYSQAVSNAKAKGIVNEHVVNATLGLAFCLETGGQRAAAVKDYEEALRLTANEETKKKIREHLKSLADGQSKGETTPLTR